QRFSSGGWRGGESGALAAEGNIRGGFESEGKIGGGLEALLRAFVEATVHDALQASGKSWNEIENVGGIFAENRRHGFRGGGLLKSALARQHFIEDGAECKNVRAMIGALTADLLWGHIADSAHDHAGLRDAANGNRAVLGSLQRLGELGQSEVKDFDAPLFGKKKIFRLEVAMDDAAIMSGLQAMGDLHAVVNHFADGQGAAFHGLAEIFAGEQLRDEIGRALVAAHVVHSQNVWMIQSGGGASFLFKALQALRVSGEIQQ